MHITRKYNLFDIQSPGNGWKMDHGPGESRTHKKILESNGKPHSVVCVNPG